MAVDASMIELVRIAEQTFVAGRAALIFPFGQLFASVSFEMAQLQCLKSDFRNGCRFVNQSLPNADAALSGLPKDDAPIVTVADQFGGNFLFLDLVHDLDRALKRVSEGGQKTLIFG